MEGLCDSDSDVDMAVLIPSLAGVTFTESSQQEDPSAGTSESLTDPFVPFRPSPSISVSRDGKPSKVWK